MKCWVDEAEAGIKIAGRNISNLKYADDTTLKTEIEEELNSLLMKVKEESENAGLKFNIQKTKIWHLVPSFQVKEVRKQWKQWQTIFLGSKITADGDCSREIKRCLLLGRKAMPNLESTLKNRDITLPTKIHIVNAMVFPVVTYGCEFSSVQSLSHVRLFAIPWTAARQASLSITNSQSSLKLMSIESVMWSNHLILCRPLLLLPSIFPSNRVFSNESVLCIRWPKYWSFSFSISPSNEYSGLISFRMDWLDLLVVQGTLKSLLPHHSLKHQFFGTQLSL